MIDALLLISALGLPTQVADSNPPADIRCGLGKEFHGARRAALSTKLEKGLVLVRGLGPTRGYTRFHQDKAFWYLTGIESPDAALVMDLERGEEWLFLPARNPGLEAWDGEMWDVWDAWVPGLSGLDRIRPIGELLSFLGERTKEGSLVWISKQPHIELSGCHDRAIPADRQQAQDPLDGRASREDALARNLKEKLKVEVRDLSPSLSELRRIKTPEEIVVLRRASEIGSLAMIEAIRSSRAGLGEWQLDALMSFVHRREGSAGAAYQAIIGSGPNALILHYSAVARRMQAGEMLLIDYAPEYEHYLSDITRSWPVDGKFTPRMMELYDAVLEAQEAGIAAVRPGVTMRQVEQACREVLRKKGLEHMLTHGTCHYVGLEVHDVGDGSKPVEPGVVFTVEPGLYERSTGIGIRIEDVVLVTKEGCEVLSALAPKDRAMLERLVASEGLLDREDPQLWELIPELRRK
jgi:Xaa-Pro aminopeptidase